MSNIPKLFSQKQIKLNTYGQSINLINDKKLSNADNKLLVLTAFGIVSGTYQVLEDLKENDEPKEIYELITHTYKQILKETYKNEPDVKTNFCRSIVLKDVTIITSSKIKFNMPFIELFDDQIIGVTLGNISE